MKTPPIFIVIALTASFSTEELRTFADENEALQEAERLTRKYEHRGHEFTVFRSIKMVRVATPLEIVSYK